MDILDAVSCVPLNLDKERHLLFTLNGLIKIEKITGLNLLDQAQLWNTMNMTRALTLLQVGLEWEEPGINLEAVASMIDGGNINHVFEKLLEVWGRSLGMLEPETPRKPLEIRLALAA